MAKVILSALVSSITGKLGGSSFQYNRQGLTLKNNPIPNNLRKGGSAHAQSIGIVSLAHLKYILALVVKSWQQLAPAQQSAWQQQALALTSGLGNLGSTRLLGYHVYVKCNVRLLLAQGTFINDPPLLELLPSIGGISFDTVTSTDLLVDVGLNVTAGFKIIWEASPTYQQAKVINQSAYRIIDYTDDSTTFPYSLYDNYVLHFGAPLSGGYMGVRATVIDMATGAISPYYYINTIVA